MRENIYKNPSFAKGNKYFHYIRQINQSLLKHRNSIINVCQIFEFASVASNNLRKSSISDVWQGFEFVFVAIIDFRKKDSY